MIHVQRIGFEGFAHVGTEDDYDGPEQALQAVLRRMVENGNTIVSVSVLRSTRRRERYEAFIVFTHGGGK